MQIMQRDYTIVQEVARWRYCLGRQIKELAGFSGQRACDRRLKILVDEGFLERKHILYGIAGLYFVTAKGIREFNVAVSKSNPRLEQIRHDLFVVDTAISVMKSFKLDRDKVKSEKEIRHSLGFTTRNHQPDFTFIRPDKGYECCVEVELTFKGEKRLENNIRLNFSNYDRQYWVFYYKQTNIKTSIQNLSRKYHNVRVIDLEAVEKHVKP